MIIPDNTEVETASRTVCSARSYTSRAYVPSFCQDARRRSRSNRERPLWSDGNHNRNFHRLRRATSPGWSSTS
jgi:hypothetical protein